MASFYKEIICNNYYESASAACKPQRNKPYTFLKISWTSKIDPNIAIPPLILKSSQYLSGFELNFNFVPKINLLDGFILTPWWALLTFTQPNLE